MPAVQQPKKRQPGRRSEPKLFRCTGFGHCEMVFTRSEHLARHARKHTGEKPFRCVVPNCDRMFSRFDNMIQHTHTHNMKKNKDVSDLSDGKSSPISVPEEMHPPIPTSPKSYAEYQKLYMNGGSKILPAGAPPRPPTPNNKLPIYAYPPYYHPQQIPPSPTSEHQQYYSPAAYPLQPWPPVYYAPNTPPQYYHPAAAIIVPPPPPPHAVTINNQPQQQQSNNNNSSSVPPTADNYSNNVRKNSIHSETTIQYHHKRRLSYVELTTPIQELGESNYHYQSSNNSTIKGGDDSTVCTDNGDEDDDDDERHMSPISMDNDCTTTTDKKSRFKTNGIDITADEYEALQGFGKFCTEPVVREPMLMTRITTSPTCSISYPIQLEQTTKKHAISPTAVLSNNTTLPSQVHAFRQQILTVQESFKRGSGSSN